MLNNIKYIFFSCLFVSSMIYACTNCYIPVSNPGENQQWASGAIVVLDGSSSYDPEGSDLTYLWTSSDESISLQNNMSVNSTFSVVLGDTCSNNQSACDTAADCEEFLCAGGSTDGNVCVEAADCEDFACFGGGYNDGNSCITVDDCVEFVCIGGEFEDESCTSTADCGEEECIGGTNDGNPCTTDADCETLLCDGGTNNGNSCSVDADCETSFCSDDGSICTADADCEEFICLFDPVQTSCEQNSDCLTNFCSSDGATCDSDGGSCATIGTCDYSGVSCGNYNGISCDNLGGSCNDFSGTCDLYNLDYTFSLVVNDGELDSEASSITITIVPNTAPSISLNKENLEVFVGEEFILDASNSDDEDSLTGNLIFEWMDASNVFEEVLDDETINNNDAIVKYRAPSSVSGLTNYTITLNLCDGDVGDEFLCATKDIIVTVIANQAPISIPGPDLNVRFDETFTLDGSLSYDPDGTISTYQWTIPDGFEVVGGTNQAVITVTSPSENGDYSNGEKALFTLTVNDGEENSKTNLGQDLFISDYCAHPEDEDAWSLEIYNPTDNVIDFRDYKILSEREFTNALAWDDEDFYDVPNSIDSGGAPLIQPGETIVITYKRDNNSDAAELINFDAIAWDYWNKLNLPGNNAFALVKNVNMVFDNEDPDVIVELEADFIDAIGNIQFPGQGWDVAGIGEATKQSQLTRKDTVFKGNINVDCLEEGYNNNACWSQSAGTSSDDSEWIYNEDADNKDNCQDDCWNYDECTTTCNKDYQDGSDGCIYSSIEDGGCGIDEDLIESGISSVEYDLPDFTDESILTSSQIACAAECLVEKLECDQGCDDAITSSELACRDACAVYHDSILDVDSWNTMGSHYCAVCDNELWVTITDNTAPTALLNSEFSETGGIWAPYWSAEKGATVTLDASNSTDPEGTALEFTWSSQILENNGIQFISHANASILNEIVTVTIPSNFPDTSIDDISLTVSDGALADILSISINVTESNTAPTPQINFSSMANEELSYSSSSDLNNLFNQCLIDDCSSFIDVDNVAGAYDAVNNVGSGYVTDPEQCYIDCANKNILIDDELTTLYEGYDITFTGKNSTDDTNTGVITYSWNVSAEDGGPVIEFEDSENSDFSFTLPFIEENNIGNDYLYRVTLTVSDGDESANTIYQFYLKSRIPKLVITQTLFEDIDEGSFILLDASSSDDPLESDLDDIKFDWVLSATEAKALVLSGYCSTNPSISCKDSSCGGTCVVNEEEVPETSTAFVYVPKSIGEEVEYAIIVEAKNSFFIQNYSHEVCVLKADNDGNGVNGSIEQGKYDECIAEFINEELVSLNKKITIDPTVIEPVSNAGYTYEHLWLNDDWEGSTTPHPEIVVGMNIDLNGYRSFDPQEVPVESSYWAYDCNVIGNCSGSTEEWEDPDSKDDLKIIAFYDELLGLIPKDNYMFNWYLEDGSWTSNEVNPVYTSTVAGDYEFKLYIENTIDGSSSDTSTVTISVVENTDPIAVVGNHRIYNKSIPGWYADSAEEVRYLYGANGSTGQNDEFRALTGTEYMLYGNNSYDPTPRGELAYTWISPSGTPLGECVDDSGDVINSSSGAFSEEACCTAKEGNLWSLGFCVNNCDLVYICNANNELTQDQCCNDYVSANIGDGWDGEKCLESGDEVSITEYGWVPASTEEQCDSNTWIKGCYSDIDCPSDSYTDYNYVINNEAVNVSFSVPTDLCEDGVSLTEKLCCENNNGTWTANHECIDLSGSIINNWTKEKELSFILIVSDDLNEIDSNGINYTSSAECSEDPSCVEAKVVYSAYSAPDQPTLYATNNHAEIKLLWNNIAENSIDDLTQYADFQGYRLYKSIDYGKTWLANDGDNNPDPIYQEINGREEIVGWEPYAQFHADAERDSTYCLYKNDFGSCSKNYQGEDIPVGEAVRRYDDINGVLELAEYPEYLWINYGSAESDTGLVQTYVDNNVIDGVEYTYMITSYDGGVRPPEVPTGGILGDYLQKGRFGDYELNEQGNVSEDWNSNIWAQGKPIHSFREFVKADSFYFYKMHTFDNPSFNILESSIGCKDEWGLNCRSEDFQNISGTDGLVYRLEIPQEYIDEGFATLDGDGHMIEEKIEVVEENVVWPTSNPDQFPAMYSLESAFCSSEEISDDKNCVTISPGYKASNVTFPDDSQLDEFIAKDCVAVGDGDKYYEVVDESQFISGYVKLEIKAEQDGALGFENYLSDNACLYAYRVEKVDYPSSPSEYLPLFAPAGESDEGYLSSYLITQNPGTNNNPTINWVYSFPNGGYLSNGSECNTDEISDSLDEASAGYKQCDYSLLSNIEVDPGVSIDEAVVDCSNFTNQAQCVNASECSYDSESSECKNILYVHIPNYLIECHELSYTDDLDAVSNWTDIFGGISMRFDNALRDEPVGSESAALTDLYSAPDSSLAPRMFYSPTYGKLLLKYAQSAFSKKPAYDYEIELSTSYIDTAYFSDYGGKIDDFDHTDECGRKFGTPLPFKIKNLTTGEYVKIAHSDGNGIWNNIGTEIPSWYTGDADSYPGQKDCAWSPGEWLTFYENVVSGGEKDPAEAKTFKFEFSYTARMVETYKPYLCSDVETYDPTKSYSKNTCVADGENTTSGIWRAASAILPSDNDGFGFVPGTWYEGVIDTDEGTIGNVNPWTPVYPWNDGDKITIKPQKWFVNGDYWIADMSMLGASTAVTDENLAEISVVPNPYIISSRFNESTHSNRLRFTHLPQKCNIKIYTISGEFVDEIIHDDAIDGNEYWDLRNASGRKVAPGLYIYVVQADNFKTKTGKFAIIR